jgi:hypothetical protein
MRRQGLIASVIAGLLFGALVNGPASAERRVALVIGNSNYHDPNLNLANPKNDASDVARVLRSIGFETIEATDATKREFERAMEQFALRASQADSVLFYYAGHAMQFQGRNYLMPVDARLENEFSVRYQMVPTDDIRDALDRASGVKIMILDACRNNPLAERLKMQMAGQHRGAGTVRGLARVDTTQGMVVAYATGADQVAMDGSGRNSPYTMALVKRMQEPGLEIGMMFRKITQDVFEETSGRQRPATYTDLTTTFYLNQADRLAWDRIKDSTDPNVFNDFIGKFPSSPHALTAKNKMDMFDRFARERRETEALLAKLSEERRLLADAAKQRQQDDDQAKATAAAQHAKEEEAKRREAEEREAKAAAERDRIQREAALRREEEERQAKAAAEREHLEAAERERLAKEAALRREAEAKAAATAEREAKTTAERDRLQREATQRREAEEQQAKLAAAERARKVAEAARIREVERQALLAAGARMRAEREAAERREAEAKAAAERKAKAAAERQEAEAKAASEKERLEKEAALRRAQEQQAQLAAAAAQRLAEHKTSAPQAKEEPAKPTAIAVAALNNPPASESPRLQHTPTDTPELVHAAQVELRRLGCFSGREDGALGEQTRTAVRKYLAGRGRSAEEVAITADLLSDMKSYRRHACETHPVASHPSSKPPRTRARRQPRSEETASARPAARPAPSAPAPQQPRRMIGIGF